jgi:hypothetical protein
MAELNDAEGKGAARCGFRGVAAAPQKYDWLSLVLPPFSLGQSTVNPAQILENRRYILFWQFSSFRGMALEQCFPTSVLEYTQQYICVVAQDKHTWF